MSRLLVYGAAGYTGGLIVDEALAFGLDPIIAGRAAGKLERRARADRLEVRCAALDDASATREMLKGVAVVINAAGPFHATAQKLARAALAQGTHYLDISGEVKAMTAVAELDREAVRRGVMLMPGVGFDVVPSDCLVAHVARRLPSARSLDIGLKGLDLITRGSALSLFEQYADLVTVRRDGRLRQVRPGELEEQFDFGSGPVRAAAITWGDVVSAYRTAAIPNITVFYEATPIVQLGLNVGRSLGWASNLPLVRSWLMNSARLLPAGPSQAQRARGRASIVVRASDASGRRVEARVTTPEVYSFTATTAVTVADRVLHGHWQPGFCSPASVYGSELVLSLPGVSFQEVC